MRGNGTSSQPYVIETSDDFYAIPTILASRSNPNQRLYFVLETDVELRSNHTPINLSNVVLDGQYFALQNLSYSSSSRDNFAIFGTVTNSELRNLVLRYNTITARDSVACLCVSATNSTIERVGSYGCRVVGRNTVAGLCAQISNTTLRECFVEAGRVEGQNTVGGLVAIVLGSSIISESYTRVTVRQTGSGAIVGGFIAWIKKSTTAAANISNCFADSTIQADTQTDVRGFIGRIST